MILLFLKPDRFLFLCVIFLFSLISVEAKPTSFVYKSDGNPDVQTFIVAPKKIDSKTRILIVMSGMSRNSDDYLESWTDWAVKNNYVAVSPMFDEKNWDGSRGYNLGNVFTGDEGRGELNPRSKWSFTIVEGIHQQVRRDYKIADEQFDIFGHSAGAQFIHRFVLFMPKAQVRYAIIANAGWFTLPDLNVNYPYGLKTPLVAFTKSDLMEWTGKKVIIMRGTEDTSREGVLRKTAEADAQGPNRFLRSGFMFEKVKAFDVKTNWQLIDVPGVAHDQKGMALAAQAFLQKAD